MVEFHALVENPWSNLFRTLSLKSGRLTKTKAWEVEVSRTNGIIGFSLIGSPRCGDAWVRLDCSFLSFGVSAQVYDTRNFFDNRN